jgi:hypothetical protein
MTSPTPPPADQPEPPEGTVDPLTTGSGGQLPGGPGTNPFWRPHEDDKS